MADITDLALVWGSPGDIQQESDGGGEYASTFRLTPPGVAKVARALGIERFRDAELCGCERQYEGDGIHVAGEPVDTICLASPLVAEPGDSRPAEGSGPNPQHGDSEVKGD